MEHLEIADGFRFGLGQFAAFLLALLVLSLLMALVGVRSLGK